MQFDGIDVTWLGHAAFRLVLGDGTTIYIDPWLDGNPTCPESEHHPERADAIYITHGHFDHVGNSVALAKATGAQVFAIHEIATWLESQGVENVVGSNMGGEVTGPGGVGGTLVPAIHSSGISGDQGIVPGGNPGGWVLDVPAGPTFYHAGDTMAFGDQRLIGDLWSPDVAMLPIGGHYTMGPAQAALAARMVGAGTVIPMHFGTFPILAGTPAQLNEAAGGDFKVAVLEIGA